MLKGESTYLRAVERKDLGQLIKWRNNPEYRKYFREYRELNTDNQQAWFENTVLKDNSVRMFAILNENKELIGACGLCYIDWVNRSADFSIYIGADDLYIDDLYSVDAARVMIDYGFNELNLHRLWAEIYDFDKPKIKMFDTLNFDLDGRHKETHWTEGKWCDSLYYRLIR